MGKKINHISITQFPIGGFCVIPFFIPNHSTSLIHPSSSYLSATVFQCTFHFEHWYGLTQCYSKACIKITFAIPFPLMCNWNHSGQIELTVFLHSSNTLWEMSVSSDDNNLIKNGADIQIRTRCPLPILYQQNLQVCLDVAFWPWCWSYIWTQPRSLTWRIVWDNNPLFVKINLPAVSVRSIVYMFRGCAFPGRHDC